MPDEIGGPAEDGDFGRSLVVLQIRDLPSEDLEAVLEVVASLPLEDVVARSALLVVALTAVQTAGTDRVEPLQPLRVVLAFLDGGGHGGCLP